MVFKVVKVIRVDKVIKEKPLGAVCCKRFFSLTGTALRYIHVPAITGVPIFL